MTLSFRKTAFHGPEGNFNANVLLQMMLKWKMLVNRWKKIQPDNGSCRKVKHTTEMQVEPEGTHCTLLKSHDRSGNRNKELE